MQIKREHYLQCNYEQALDGNATEDIPLPENRCITFNALRGYKILYCPERKIGYAIVPRNQLFHKKNGTLETISEEDIMGEALVPCRIEGRPINGTVIVCITNSYNNLITKFIVSIKNIQTFLHPEESP